MTIREAIATILAGYGSAKSQAFAGHALARVARHDFPDAVRAVIPEEHYLVEGSAGQGQWGESRYGKLGKDFIEIHHLVPISELRGLMVSSHPERDYAAICSNRHSMIHRIKAVHDIETLRARLR